MCDAHRLPSDPESVRADRLHVISASDEDHIFMERQETAEETAHRARAEDEDFHSQAMESAEKTLSLE